MSGPEALTAFFSFCGQHNARFIRPIPQRTTYEQMLADLEDGDPAVQTAFNWARQVQKTSAEAILTEWRRYAESERASLRATVPVSHSLAAAAAAAALDEFSARLRGASPELLELYRRHDGASLFVDLEDAGSGLFFYPIAEMAAEREALAERLDQPPMETEEDGQLQIYGRPAWLDSAVVFGGFGYAPERLVLSTEGEYRGSVFLFRHDPQQLVRLASSFGELLEQLCRQAQVLLSAHGGAAYQGASAYLAEAGA